MVQYFPLLSTKYSIPPVRTHVLPRPRLYKRLRYIEKYQFTLVCAPAGFGKTTLLSEWYISSREETSPPPVAWLSLDENDNDAIRFWSYVIAALDTLRAGIGKGALELLHASQPSPIDAVLRLFLNELATFPTEVVFILDDYHLISTPSIHATVEFLLDHLPSNVHLVMISRTDPPLPLARLRARSQLYELYTSDICFTYHEATTFLNEIMQLALPEDALAKLESRIEGWIAGWYLAALALRGYEDISSFVAAFTGSHRYIIDYLVEEVLHRQSEQVQRFLLQTSIIERLQASLCNALTNEANGQQMLYFLDQEHAFILPLDNERQWYRYHPLFAEALRTQLQQVYPEWVSELHSSASRWYESHKLLIDAIDHALLATDYERAAILIEEVARTSSTIWVRRGSSVLQQWLNILPLAFLRTQPQLCILHAWELLSSLQRDPTIRLEAVEEWLYNADAHLQNAGETSQKQAMHGEIAVLFATTSFIKGDISRSTKCAQQALDFLPQGNTTLRGSAAQTLVNVYALSGDPAAAGCALGELLSICQVAHNLHARLNALHSIAQIQVLQGQLRQAAATYRHALQPSDPPLELAISSAFSLGLGSLLLEWNEIDAAAQTLVTAIEQCKERGDPGILIYGYKGLARLRQIQGDNDGAFEALEETERILQKYHILFQHKSGVLLKADIAVSRTRLYLDQGNLGAANRWAQTLQQTENADITSLHMRELYTLAQVYLANQQIEKSLTLLMRLLPIGEQRAHVADRIALLSLQALALSAQGDQEQALPIVNRALSLAEPGGYIRLFIDGGQPMASLLEKLLIAYRQGHHAFTLTVGHHYLCQLLAAFGIQTIAQTKHTPQEKAIMLSKREIEVLNLLAAGLSDREIASKLVLAEGTIKTHAKRIYAKLGVQNRIQAVLYAKELHLL